jgi:diketogulonate reductase-like aldo/keto reductase
MKFATSASGRQIPMLGLGTWQLTGDTVAEAVRTALSLGYRHIDTAEAYRNHVTSPVHCRIRPGPR